MGKQKTEADLWREVGLEPPLRLRQGFATMEPSKRAEYGKAGGKKAQARGTGHSFAGAVAKEAGKKGAETRWAKWRAERVLQEQAFVTAVRRHLGDAVGYPESTEVEAKAIKDLYDRVHAERVRMQKNVARPSVSAVAENLAQIAMGSRQIPLPMKSRAQGDQPRFDVPYGSLGGFIGPVEQRQREMFEAQMERDLAEMKKAPPEVIAAMAAGMPPAMAAGKPPISAPVVAPAPKPQSAAARASTSLPPTRAPVGKPLSSSELLEMMKLVTKKAAIESGTQIKPLTEAEVARLDALMARKR